MRKGSSQLPVVSSQEKTSRRRREGGLALRSSESAGGSPSPRYSLFLIPYSSRLKLIANRSTLNANVNPRSGFTLVEITITVFIIMILLLGTVLIIDPFEQIYRAQDGQRSEEMGTLDGAIRAVRSDIGGSFDPDGPYNLDADTACSGEADQRVFVSVPSDNGETSPTDLPSGWLYARVAEAKLYDADGTGWLPVDFNASSVAGLSNLPVDPTNTFASGYYYTYVCGRAPSGFEVTARIRSEKFRTGGGADAQSTDGGDDIFVLEKGTDLQLDPKAPVGYWAFDEGAGTTTDDSNGTNIGTLTGSTLPVWLADTSCIFGNCLDFDGATYTTDSRVDAGEDSSLDITANLSVAAWVYSESGLGAEGRTAVSKYTNNAGYPSQRGWNFGAQWNFFDHFRFDILDSAGEASMAYIIDFFVDNLNQWAHTVGTYEPSVAVRIYLNGSAEMADTTSVAAAITYGVGSDPFTIGQRSADALSEWDGRIDEVMIWDRTLDPVEIAYQYEALKP